MENLQIYDIISSFSAATTPNVTAMWKICVCAATSSGTWRTARGIEPLHLYYASCDILSSSQIDDLLPEDSVPVDLHMKPFHDLESDDAVTLADFTAGCAKAVTVARLPKLFWRSSESDLAATDNDSFEDFFHALLQEAASDPKHSSQFGSLTVHWLASFMLSSLHPDVSFGN